MSKKAKIAIVMYFLSLSLKNILFEIKIRIPLTSVAFRYFFISSRVADIIHGVFAIAALLILAVDFIRYIKNRGEINKIDNK